LRGRAKTPATGEWITYTAIAADNDGQLVRFTWRSVPGGVITEHIHPHQEERFTILAGEAHFTPGRRATHSPSGRDDRRARGCPALRGKPRGAPRNPLQLGATFWHFRHESGITSPPIWAQNLMLPPLWALAKAFGIRPYYQRWDSRIARS
jgi:hypothetical protein